jgi:hypothetical protein
VSRAFASTHADERGTSYQPARIGEELVRNTGTGKEIEQMSWLPTEDPVLGDKRSCDALPKARLTLPVKDSRLLSY